MSFSKAVQKIPEYAQYVQDLLVYKAACKKYKMITQKYKNSDNPASRLAYFEAQVEYKQACKAYTIARAKYLNAIAEDEIRQKNPKIGELELFKLPEVVVPLSIRDMMEQEKRAKAMENMTAEQQQVILKAAVQGMIDRGMPVKEQFLRQVEDKKDISDDPTLGFDSPFGMDVNTKAEATVEDDPTLGFDSPFESEDKGE